MESFLFEIPFNGTLYEFKGFQPVDLYTQDLVKFLRCRLFLDIFFKMAGSGRSTSFGWRSFIHCFVERVERLRMFIHSDRVKVLYCFVWNYREPGNMYLLEMTELVVVFRFFMLYWTRYHTDHAQMLKKKCQNIRQNGHWMLENSCKVGLLLEGAHCHLETVNN